MADLEEFFRYFMNPPDCGCRLFERCPYCGAGQDQDCIRFCCYCDAEWAGSADNCPCCGAAKTLGGCGDPRNPKECPEARNPRPWAPPCEHVVAAGEAAEAVIRDYGLTIQRLVVACLQVNKAPFHYRKNPDTYRQPAVAARGKKAYTLKGRIAVLSNRVQGGAALRHPEDWYIGKKLSDAPERAERLGQQILRPKKNGGKVYGGLKLLGTELPKPIPNEVDHGRCRNGPNESQGGPGVREPDQQQHGGRAG